MLSLNIASRYLRARKSHSAVGVIALVSMLGIAVATAAIVCVLSVFNGFANVAQERLSVFDPDLKITAATGKIIPSADSLARRLSAIDGVDMALPVVEEQALAVYGSRQSVVHLKGVTPGFGKFSPLESTIIDGEYRETPDDLGSYATLSVGSAISLQAHPGYYDWLHIYVPRRVGRINPAMPMSAFRGDSLIVSGVFQLDQSEYDTDLIIIPIDMARRMLDYGSNATAIELRLTPGADPATVAASVKELCGTGMKVADSIEQQASTFKMIEVEKWITLMLLVFILVIASFNIVSTLSMLVLEKRADMATLSALGARHSLLRRIFMNEAMILTLTGGAIGMVVGVSLALAQQWGGFIKLGGDPTQLSIPVYPVRVEITDLIVVALAVIAVGAVVSLITMLIVDASRSIRRVSE